MSLIPEGKASTSGAGPSRFGFDTRGLAPYFLRLGSSSQSDVRLPGNLIGVGISGDGSASVVASTCAVGFWPLQKRSAQFVRTCSPPTSCSISSDGLRAATTHMDSTLRLWSVNDRCCLATVFVGQSLECKVLPDRVMVVVTGTYQSEIVSVGWDTVMRQPRQFPHRTEIISIDVSSSESVMVAVHRPPGSLSPHADLCIQYYMGRSRTRYLHAAVFGHVKNACVRIAKNASWVVVADSRGLRLYHTTNELLDCILDNDAPPGRRCCAISSHGTRVIDTYGSSLRLWSSEHRALLAVIDTCSPIRSLALSDNGRTAVLGGANGLCSVNGLWPNSDIFPTDNLRTEKVFCTVCQEDVKEGEMVIQLPCAHVFHYACMKTYLDTEPSPRCPLCRNPVHNWIMRFLPMWTWYGSY